MGLGTTETACHPARGPLEHPAGPFCCPQSHATRPQPLNAARVSSTGSRLEIMRDAPLEQAAGCKPHAQTMESGPSLTVPPKPPLTRTGEDPFGGPGVSAFPFQVHRNPHLEVHPRRELRCKGSRCLTVAAFAPALPTESPNSPLDCSNLTYLQERT